MTISEIEGIARTGENDRVEFKKTTGQVERGAATLCAFLNGSGGLVVFGVTREGKVVGQLVSDGTMQDVAQVLRRFDPPAPASVHRVPLPGSTLEVIVLEASPGDAAVPFTFGDRPYERSGTTTSVMPQERYQRLLLERAHASHRWENAAANADIQDLDEEETRRTVRVAVAAGRLPESTSSEPNDILDRLGLRTGGRLVNAAMVVFGRRFLPEYPQCQLRMARFRGVTKSEFLDQRQLHGHLFALLDEAMLFLSRHLPVAGRIQPGIFERADEPLFPPAALREALVNAFCHRDYSSLGGAVSLAIFDDRLEIWSDGTLPFGMRVTDLKRDHLSRPRNPLIAEVCYRRGFVERWGRGTQKIVELCVQAGHPEPEFIEQAGAVGVLFFPSGYIAPYRVSHDLTERQREVLAILARRSPLSFREIRRSLGQPIAERTLRDDLLHLKRTSLIGSKGHGRGAAWFLEKAGGSTTGGDKPGKTE